LSQKTFWNFVMPDFAGFLYLKSPKRSDMMQGQTPTRCIKTLVAGTCHKTHLI
jgi:hypothetical protein